MAEKLYTKQDYIKACEEANATGKIVTLVQREVEYEVEVLEWKKKNLEQSIYNEEGEFVGYETVKVDDYDSPIMVEEIDSETGKTILVQKHHTETRVKTVEVIELNNDDKAIYRKFFYTSLGYVKRKATMQDGTVKDFLADILPILQVGIPILTYTEEGEQNKVLVTEEFIDECKQQVIKDFYGNI